MNHFMIKSGAIFDVDLQTIRVNGGAGRAAVVTGPFEVWSNINSMTRPDFRLGWRGTADLMRTICLLETKLCSFY
jgi:hypothetical protein